MEEVWKDIEGYERLYQVSNLGRIKSLRRLKDNHGKKQLVEEKIKKSRNHPSGYLVTDLYKDNIARTVYIHRTVAEAFIPNIENKETVNHINLNKKDNRVENLEWATPLEQNIHYFNSDVYKNKDKVIKRNVIEAMNKANSKKVKCLETGKIYNSIVEAAKEYKISGTLISKVCKEKRRTAGKVHWCYI